MIVAVETAWRHQLRVAGVVSSAKNPALTHTLPHTPRGRLCEVVINCLHNDQTRAPTLLLLQLAFSAFLRRFLGISGHTLQPVTWLNVYCALNSAYCRIQQLRKIWAGFRLRGSLGVCVLCVCSCIPLNLIFILLVCLSTCFSQSVFGVEIRE